MERIWAPWRMEYIAGDDSDECFLCRSISESCDPKNLLLKRGQDCGIIMNRYPYTNGHVLVFPYRHVRMMSEMGKSERLEMMDLIDESLETLRATMTPDGFNIGYNLGKTAGAGLEDHIHAHIVPRWNGDTNFMPVLGDVRVIPQSLTALYEQLKPLFV